MFFFTAPCFITCTFSCIRICFVGVTICLTSSVSLVHKATILGEGFDVFSVALYFFDGEGFYVFSSTISFLDGEGFDVFSLALYFFDEGGYDLFSSTLYFLDGEGFDVFSLALSFLDGEGSDEFSSSLSFLKQYVKIASIRRIFPSHIIDLDDQTFLA